MLSVYLRSFVGWTLSWHALHSFCITLVGHWWMHYQKGGENCTNHTLGRDALSRESFGGLHCFWKGEFCFRGSFWVFCSIVTCSNSFCHMTSVEPLPSLLEEFMWLSNFFRHMTGVEPLLPLLEEFMWLCLSCVEPLPLSYGTEILLLSDLFCLFTWFSDLLEEVQFIFCFTS